MFDRKAYMKKWRADNPDRIKEYRKRHPSKTINQTREWRKRNPGYDKKYYKNNIIKIKHYKKTHFRERQRYKTSILPRLRKTILVSKNNKVYTGLHKRHYPNYCELCGRMQEKGLNYHHWNDNNPNMGLWLCLQCHIFVERIEKGITEKKYKALKHKVEQEILTRDKQNKGGE